MYTPNSEAILRLSSFAELGEDQFMEYNRLEKSGVLTGRPGVFTRPEEFPISNVVIAPDRYSYEGNWLFCSFNHPELLGARVGFGKGRIDWRDYGLDEAPMTENALFCRVEVVTAKGIYAYLSSSSTSGQNVRLVPDRFEVQFEVDGNQLIHLSGWPNMHWKSRNPQGTLGVDLWAQVDGMLVWPDCVLPRNTFGMCLGTSRVKGNVHIEGGDFSVQGNGIFDHPRIQVEENKVARFGWYLYSPVQFADGTQLACYYSQDGVGERDSIYSAALLTLADGKACWLGDCKVVDLKLDPEGLPVRWEILLSGEGTQVSLRVKVRQIPFLRGWGDADPARAQRKYVAYPLLMEVEGEAEFRGQTVRLAQGRGIAEFLVRKGLQPKFP
jgi:hypothetical protein